MKNYTTQITRELSLRDRILILIACFDPLWKACTYRCVEIADVISDLRRCVVTYNSEDFLCTISVLENIVSGLTAQYIDINEQRQIIQEIGDWYGNWELSNQLRYLRSDIDTLRCIAAYLKNMSIYSSADFNKLLNNIATMCRERYLLHGYPFPEQMRRRLPHELPWELFQHLKGGNVGLSIFQRVDEYSHTCIVDVIAEIAPPALLVRQFDVAWRTDTIRSMARQILLSGNFSNMPIVGDLLQDACCEEYAILSHCMHTDHKLGCWLLDSILGFYVPVAA